MFRMVIGPIGPKSVSLVRKLIDPKVHYSDKFVMHRVVYPKFKWNNPYFVFVLLGWPIQAVHKDGDEWYFFLTETKTLYDNNFTATVYGYECPVYCKLPIKIDELYLFLTNTKSFAIKIDELYP